VGTVTTPLTVTNRADQIEAERGHRPAGEVRSVALDEVLVDTGAMTLALPADVIAQLGLALREEISVLTASGPGTARLFQDAAISLLGREGTFDCLELPTGMPPLLGVVPMEMLGLEPDLRQQRLRVLPREPGNTYVTIL
jgi:predicted aspartyl protease